MPPDESQSAGKARRVTINDVSKAIGLTKSTVSRALNGYPDISETTRRRVVKMAEKLNYRPLSPAQAIRTGRVRSIGFIIETAEHDAHRPFLAEFLAGISQSAGAEGWTLTVAASSGGKDTLEILEALVDDRKADGFILPRTMVDDPRVEALKSRGIPFVMFGRTGNAEGCAWYDIAGEEAMRTAVLHLAKLGHRRIAFVNGGKQYNYSPLRRAGYERGMKEAGLPVSPELLCEDCLDRPDGARAAREVLSCAEPPTAFVYALDRAALGLYDAAAAFGLTVGRDISVIAYDGIAEAERMNPPLSTYAVDIRRAGERLGALFIRRARGEPASVLREIEHARFIDRGSANAPARSSKKIREIVREQNALDL